MECLLGEADLYLNDRTFVDDACPGLALVDKELVTGDLDRLSLLQVAHQTTKEVRFQDLTLDQLNRLVRFTIGNIKRFLSWPNRSHSHNPDTLRHTRVHLDLGPIGNGAKERSAILHEELIVLDLKDLPLE